MIVQRWPQGGRVSLVQRVMKRFGVGFCVNKRPERVGAPFYIELFALSFTIAYECAVFGRVYAVEQRDEKLLVELEREAELLVDLSDTVEKEEKCGTFLLLSR